MKGNKTPLQLVYGSYKSEKLLRSLASDTACANNESYETDAGR